MIAFGPRALYTSAQQQVEVVLTARYQTESTVTELTETIIAWQRQHGRHALPWQQQVTPYKVLVSELMLQQTQVATVIPYFERWLAAFPDLQTLALADEDEVMRLWQGLGYYARARNLHKAAKYLSALPELPSNLAGWLAVPGVGRYTAGAILSFAYDQYGPIVDGNVRRLFCRLFALDGIPGSSALEKRLWQYAEQLTPASQNRSFAQGLLDLGATICKPRQPLCEQCPLRSHCQALLKNRIEQFPNAKPKKQIPTREAHFLLYSDARGVYLEKRPSPGIWSALWCLPEHASAPTGALLDGQFSHQFSHYKLEASVWRVSEVNESADAFSTQTKGRWQCWSKLAELGLPAPLKSYLAAKNIADGDPQK